jgi:hypothetical protein
VSIVTGGAGELAVLDADRSGVLEQRQRVLRRAMQSRCTLDVEVREHDHLAGGKIGDPDPARDAHAVAGVGGDRDALGFDVEARVRAVLDEHRVAVDGRVDRGLDVGERLAATDDEQVAGARRRGEARGDHEAARKQTRSHRNFLQAPDDQRTRSG